MFEPELNANDLIHLGVNFWTVRHPDRYDFLAYHNGLRSLIDRLEKAGFVETLRVARPLYQLANQLYEQDKFVELFDERIKHFASTAAAIDNALSGEGENTTLILTDQRPPNALLSLACPEPHQEALRLDLILCLQARLSRPAFVTAWALGFDLIRSWVLSDDERLIAFNAQLAKNPRKGEPIAIVEYRDFFHLGEARFLEICRDSQAPSLVPFNDRVHRNLQSLLDQRNEFAHANDSSATPTEAIAYVERMIRIVTSPPF